jgi:phospho-N-acetylmuramoyl-pentapeptide-transferase
VSTLLWSDLEKWFVWVVLFVTLAVGVFGFVDVYKKLVLQNPAGISARQ